MAIDPVEIAVEIIEAYEDELEDLDRRLDDIDGRTLEVILNVEDGGDIEDAESDLDRLERNLEAILDIDLQGVKQAALVKEKLEDDMHSTLHIDVDRENIPDLSDMSLDVGGENGPPDIDDTSTDALKRTKKATATTWADYESGRVNDGRLSGFVPDDSTPDRVIPPGRLNSIMDPSVIPESHWSKVRDMDGVSDWFGPTRGSSDMDTSYGDPAWAGFSSDFESPNEVFDRFSGDLNADDLNINVGNQQRAEEEFMRKIADANWGAEAAESSDGFFRRNEDSRDGRGASWAGWNVAPDGTFRDWSSNWNQNDFSIEDPDWAGFQRTIGGGSGVGMFDGDGFAQLQQGTRNRVLPTSGAERGKDWTFEDGKFQLSRGGRAGVLSRAVSNTDWSEEFTKTLRRSRKILRRIIPNMRTWMNVIAAAIPLLLTLAGAAAGAVAALGGLAVAGGAIALGGIMAKGDSAAEAMRNAQREAKQLKSELFSMFQPAAHQFQPIFDRFMEQVPADMSRLVGPMQGLTEYDGFFRNAFSGSIDVVVELLRELERLEPLIRDIGNTIGDYLGRGLIKFLQGAVKELYNNQRAFLRLAKVVYDVVLAGYEFIKIFSFVLAQAAPLTDVILQIARVLSNDYMVALVGAAAAAYSLYTAVGLIGAVLMPVIGAISSFIAAGAPFAGVLTLMAIKVWELVTALSALQVAAGILAVLGGLFAYGKIKNDMQGMPSGAPSGGAGSGGYGSSGGNTVIIEGDVGRDEYQKMKDDFPGMSRDFLDSRESTERP